MSAQFGIWASLTCSATRQIMQNEKKNYNFMLWAQHTHKNYICHFEYYIVIVVIFITNAYVWNMAIIGITFIIIIMIKISFVHTEAVKRKNIVVFCRLYEVFYIYVCCYLAFFSPWKSKSRIYAQTICIQHTHIYHIVLCVDIFVATAAAVEFWIHFQHRATLLWTMSSLIVVSARSPRNVLIVVIVRCCMKKKTSYT